MIAMTDDELASVKRIGKETPVSNAVAEMIAEARRRLMTMGLLSVQACRPEDESDDLLAQVTRILKSGLIEMHLEALLLQRTELRAQNAELMADAQRYRWLRSFKRGAVFVVNTSWDDRLDSAIDAAIAEEVALSKAAP